MESIFFCCFSSKQSEIMEPLIKLKSTQSIYVDERSIEDSSISESSQHNSYSFPKDVYNPFGPEIGKVTAISPCDYNNVKGVLWVATLGLCFHRSFLGIEIDRKVIGWDSVQSISEDCDLVEIVTSTGELIELKDFEYSVTEMAKMLRIASNKNASVKSISNGNNEESKPSTWSMLRETKPLDIVVTVSAQTHTKFPLLSILSIRLPWTFSRLEEYKNFM